MSDVELTDLELKIALMWENGRDTYDISHVVGMPINFTEADIYRMLPGIRAKRRLQKQRMLTK